MELRLPPNFTIHRDRLHHLTTWIAAPLLHMAIAGLAVAAQAPVTAQRHMVVAGHPLAAEGGRAILRAGGNAVDAAVATAMVLTVVQPSESGIGGGGFLLFHDSRRGGVIAYDGRASAPSSADPNMFLIKGGTTTRKRFVGGKSVAVPGQLRLLEMVHRDHGRLSWAKLFDPAIDLADKGFPMSRRVSILANADKSIRRFPNTANMFYGAGGGAKPAGAMLRNPALANTFRAIAAHGADAFYTGAIAYDIATAINKAALHPARFEVGDLARYKARKVGPAICAPYRALTVCSAPPPASGITVLQTLGILSHFPMSKLAVNGSGAVHLFSQAHRLAYADRLRYIRDPAFGAVPTSGLISPQYLKERARLIDRNKSFGRVSPGQPTQKSGMLLPPGISPTTPPRESPSTTHIAVVDEDRNAVSFTTTLGHYFGSKILVRGFLLNDSMNAFSRRPYIKDVALANAVAPNKRPRSSMAPVIALDRRGKARLVLGSPGGNRIPAYVTKTLIAHLDWGLDIQAAIELSNHGSRTIRTELEADSSAMALKPSLKAMGHNVKIVPMPSGVHAIRIIDKGLAGGADLRREGVARGD